MAFGCLFEALYARVLGYLTARIGNQGYAEELAAAVFVQVAEGIRRFDGGGSAFVAWVFTIARHDLVDERRSRARRRTEPVADVPESAQDDDVAETVALRLDAGLLRMAIAQLTEDQRDVITLKYAGGLSNAEVASTLGKPVTAIKSLQHRALTRLRGLLIDEGVEPP